MKTLLMIALLLSTSAGAATVDDLAFLAGNWHCKVWDGAGDEIWSKPAAGNMIGMWRFIKDGKLAFTEHLLIEQEAAGPVLRLKHFYPGLKGWEEKDAALTLQLEKASSGFALFSSTRNGQKVILSYERKGNTLRGELIKEADGKRKTEVFEFTAAQ